MADAAVAGDRRRTLDVVSPRTGRVVGSFPVLGPEAVASAVSTARGVQPGWASLSPRRRAEGLVELGRVLEAWVDEVAGSIVEDTGKPEIEALAAVVVSVDLIRYYRRAAPRHLARRRVSSGWMLWKSAYVEREPLGVVGAITPWNYPLILAMDAVTSALATGNAVVVKPSEFTPMTPLMLPELCQEAGLPEGLVQVVTGDGSTGEALVQSGVDKISFTGSTVVGRKVMATAARSLTPVTLELGGKDPALVLEDADLDRAARGIAFGAFFNAGQTCISVERAYVVQEVAEEFTRRLVEVTRELRWGCDGDFDVGPMITEPQRTKVVRQIRDALAKGARVLAGGLPEDGSRIVPPTILGDVAPDMEVYREETFGPVLPVIPVTDQTEAVARANASGYGLFASVWTADRGRGLEVARLLHAGGVSVNDTLSHYGVGELPMGGVKESGFGRRRGLEGLDEMSRTRTVLVDRLGLRREPWWFPYDEGGQRLTRAILAWRARGGLNGLVHAVKRLLGR